MKKIIFMKDGIVQFITTATLFLAVPRATEKIGDPLGKIFTVTNVEYIYPKETLIVYVV